VPVAVRWSALLESAASSFCAAGHPSVLVSVACGGHDDERLAAQRRQLPCLLERTPVRRQLVARRAGAARAVGERGGLHACDARNVVGGQDRDDAPDAEAGERGQDAVQALIIRYWLAYAGRAVNWCGLAESSRTRPATWSG
jgi:hypothetical protein